MLFDMFCGAAFCLSLCSVIAGSCLNYTDTSYRKFHFNGVELVRMSKNFLLVITQEAGFGEIH